MLTAPLPSAPTGPAPDPTAPTAPTAPAARDARLRDAAVRLEATFLKEMLSAAGLGRATPGFSGGAGEEQFGSFLLEAQAQRMAEAGGIGLAESLFEALKARDDA